MYEAIFVNFSNMYVQLFYMGMHMGMLEITQAFSLEQWDGYF